MTGSSAVTSPLAGCFQLILHLVALTQHPAPEPPTLGDLFLVHIGLPIRHHDQLGIAKAVRHRPHEVG